MTFFYDIGASYGFFTLLAQEFITTGEIHSFEPNPAIFELLRINADVKNFPNTYINEIAISDKKDIVEFYDRQSTGYSFTSTLIKKANVDDYKLIKVKSERIDDYILNHKPPTIVKIDVEGAEEMVLKGSLNLIKNYNPLFIIEIFNDNPYFEAVKILKNFGYTAFYLNKNGDLQLIEDIFLFMKTKIRSGNSKNIIFKKI
jgi:FkbM family methyltransferase